MLGLGKGMDFYDVFDVLVFCMRLVFFLLFYAFILLHLFLLSFFAGANEHFGFLFIVGL
jgi:hypothetical protein